MTQPYILKLYGGSDIINGYIKKSPTMYTPMAVKLLILYIQKLTVNSL